MTALGWGYYVLVISSDCRRARRSRITHSRCRNTCPISLWPLERCTAPPQGPGILVLLAASRLSPNRPALALAAATLAGACVILVSFFPPFLAYEERGLTGSAILDYATQAVERSRWWHWLLLAGIQIPFLAACWRWLKLAHAVPPESATGAANVALRDAAPDDAVAACRVLRESIAHLCVADHRNDPAILTAWLANKTPDIVAAWARQPGNSLLLAVEGDAILAVGSATDGGEITRARQHTVHAHQHRDGASFYQSAGYVDDGAPTGKFGTGSGYLMTKRIVASH
jgi:hypothetical protein